MTSAAMKVFTSCLFSILLINSSLLALPSKKKKSKPLPQGVKLIKDIEYKNVNGTSLLLDLYLPKDLSKKAPIVMWVHGGGWLNGSKERVKSLFLVEKGFAIASINYRLTTQAIWPAQIEDCRSAVRFLRKNATSYNLDGENICAWGGSAGGHLVAVLGTQDLPKNEQISSKVQTVIDWFGPSDLLTMPPNTVSEKRTLEQVAKSNGAKLLGATVRDVPKLAKEASAFWNVSSDDSHFLIMHGSEDPGVPVSQSQRLHQKQKELNASTQLHIVQGAGHGGPLFLTDEVNSIMLNFLNKHLQ